MYNISRIMKMEELFDHLNEIISSGNLSFDQFHQMDDQIKLLEAYYTSPFWKEDFAADNDKLLPEKIKRGVLSEDGIYLLLEKYSDLKSELLK